MAEKYSLNSGKGGLDWFKLLVYGSPRERINNLANAKEFDSSDMLVELKINGVELRVEDFNAVLEDWADRIETQLKEKLEFLQSEEASKEKAREMFYNAINKLDWDE